MEPKAADMNFHYLAEHIVRVYGDPEGIANDFIFYSDNGRFPWQPEHVIEVEVIMTEKGTRVRRTFQSESSIEEFLDDMESIL